MNFRCLLSAVSYCLFAQCLILKIFAQSPGETSPRVVIGVGESANITCRMNLRMFDGANSSSLYFTTDDAKHGATRSNIVIINETTIVYTLRNASEQYTSFTCKSGQYAIANTDVIVGTKPTRVKDFTCQAFDFIYMTCSFTIPANTVPTTYNLKYVTQNAGRTADNRKIYSQNYILNCTKLVKEGDRAMCNFTLDDGSYKPNFEFYNFRLTSNNTLGSLTQNFTINHKEIVKPAISDFRVIDITTHGCALTWQMERYSSYKLNRLQMEVHLQSPHYENLKIHTCVKCNNHAIFNLQINDLPYAFYKYNLSLRIKMRMHAATWSDSYGVLFQTLPSPPELPPSVDGSSFYLNATHLRLFWYPTPEYHRNGSDFHYIVKHVLKDGDAIDQTPLHTQMPTVAFRWESIHSYEYQIWSSNEMGVSTSSSSIRVPLLSQNYENRTPLGIRNVYHALDRAYTLLWSAPEDYANLQSYTVFWCNPKSVVSNECHSIIGFTHLNRESQNFTIQQSQPLVLAVAANYADFYTGMHWAKCTADASNDLEKLEPEIMEKKAYAIIVRWSSERVCASLIKGYTLIYCKTKSTTKSKCLDKNIKINIDKSDNKYEITDLEPNSFYKMEMYMYSDVQAGPVSDALTVQTSEAAPMPPRNLSYEQITSQSVLLTWIAPYKSHGKIRSYIIIYNRESHIVNCNSTNDLHCFGGGKKSGRLGSERLMYTLANLSSFTNYTICVKAYTVADSLPSNCVQIQTLIGVPSSPSQPRFEDSNDIVIEWLQPEVPSGRVDFYDVIVETKLRESVESRHISRLTNDRMLCTIRKPSCDNNDFKYTIGVRAVNRAYANEIDPNLMHIYNNSGVHTNYISAATDELGCIEADSIRVYDDKNHLSSNYIEYHSSEIIVFNYICGAIIRSDGKIWITIFVVILGTSVIVIGGLLIFKRCHEMASINCKIPDPLNDLVNRNEGKLMPGNGDECMKPIKIQQQQSYNSSALSENGRLLPCISSDSDYTTNATERSWPETKSSYCASSDNTINDYCIQDPMTMSNTQLLEGGRGMPETTTGYMTMTVAPKGNANNANSMEAKKNSINNMLNYTEMDNNGYVRPNTLQPNASEKPFTIDWPMDTEDGYVNPSNRHAFNSICNAEANLSNTIYLPRVT